MADSTEEPRCTTCSKTKSEHGIRLKLCAKCKIPYYCSRECQKADWKTHKKACSSNASAGTSSSTSGQQPQQQPSKVLSVTIPKPFHKLDTKTWLHNRPEEDVYKLLVDTYRMRMEDDYNLEGEADADSIYGGAEDGGRRGFQRFLERVESKPGLLPTWWSSEKSRACMSYGLNPNGWSDLSCAAEKSDVIEHYGDRYMPMQLRMFGEQVYGRGPGGHDGTMMMKMQMQIENGSISEMSL